MFGVVWGSLLYIVARLALFYCNRLASIKHLLVLVSMLARRTNVAPKLHESRILVEEGFPAIVGLVLLSL
jgi:hypothetical protein